MTAKTTLPPILVVIDLQQGLVEGQPGWGARSTPSLVPNVKHLLSTWRAKSWPVFHVQHDDIFDATNPIAATHPETFAIHPCAAPLPSEKVFVKNVGSPFVASGLRAAVEELGVLGDGKGVDGKGGGEGEKEKRKIVVIGMDAAQCVSDTTRNGTDLGYKIIVVADACAAYGMDDWATGKTLSGEETHNAAMSMLMGYATVTTTDKVSGVLGY